MCDSRIAPPPNCRLSDKFMNNTLKFLSLPILSGILIGTSYIPFPPWASILCFVPLWLFWTKQSHLNNVLLGGFITAFVFTLIGFNWVAYLLHEFAHLYFSQREFVPINGATEKSISLLLQVPNLLLLIHNPSLSGEVNQ